MSDIDIGYQGYFEARGWDRDVSAENYWYYDALFKRLSLSKEARVLEIGFGDGRFMDWCTSRGLSVVGTEVQEAAVAKARARGNQATRSNRFYNVFVNRKI